MLKLGATASDVRSRVCSTGGRDQDPGVLAREPGGGGLHFYLPIRYFAMPVVVGMFFVLSEKSKAIERRVMRLPLVKYVHLDG